MEVVTAVETCLLFVSFGRYSIDKAHKETGSVYEISYDSKHICKS